MSRGRKANPALIGVFVLGAVVLSVAAVALLGSGRFFAKRQQFVCFFTGSLEGLNPGAPVKFRGVQIGEVTKMLLRHGQPTTDLHVARLPVFIEIDQKLLVELAASPRVVNMDRETLDEAIKIGLRARLETQSLVTGVLYVGLDFLPDTPAVLMLPPEGPELEIPTVPTTFQQVFANLEKVMHRLDALDLEALVASAKGAFDGVNQLARSPDVSRTVVELHDTLASFHRVTDALGPNVQPTMTDVRASLAQLKVSLESLNGTLVSLRSLLDPSAPLVVDLSSTLNELGDAARSVRALADYLERNPNAIIRGR